MAPSDDRNPIRRLWDRLAKLPGGRSLFSIAIGRLAPYTGTIRPRVLELGSGFARVSMRDRRAVRNHLDSIHAIALMNLAEVATGLALHYDLPADARAILTRLSIDFLKKARGPLIADATAPILSDSGRAEIDVEAVIRDREDAIVATAHARWLVGPKEQQSS